MGVYFYFSTPSYCRKSDSIVGTHHATEGVAKENGMTVEQGSVSTPLTRLPGSTQGTSYRRAIIKHLLPRQLVLPYSMWSMLVASVSVIESFTQRWRRPCVSKTARDSIFTVGPPSQVQAGSRRRDKRKDKCIQTNRQTQSQPHSSDHLPILVTNKNKNNAAAKEMQQNSWAREKSVTEADRKASTYPFDQPLAAGEHREVQ